MDTKPKRKAIRIQGYDYSTPGYYFITICSFDRQDLFCKIVGADVSVRPSNIGLTIQQSWNEINSLYDNIKIDQFVLMPNHIHGIIVIDECPAGGQRRPPLPKIIQSFKSYTTKMCFKYGYKKIWQRGYYERVIRNEQELAEIREYILNNPLAYVNGTHDDDMCRPLAAATIENKDL